MTNGGLLTKNQQAHLNNYGNVWYYTKAISNILSMSNVKNKNHIIYDYDNGDRFIVIIKRPVGHNIIFTVKNGGIYYNDMSNTKGVSMLSTVDKNRNNYTQRQYGHANIARELYQMAVHPFIKDYKNIIKMNAIKTFPVIIKDINRCE